jgi:single-stranded DNA-binding protein
MNHLNSILIEGVCVTKPEYSEETKQCTFRIESNRFYRANGELVKKVTFWDIVSEGKLAKEASTKKEWSKVRCVGRLDRIEGNAVIIAENIEYKGAK